MGKHRNDDEFGSETDPTEVMPAVPPDEPAVRPDEPAVRPAEPAVRPAGPSARPDQPRKGTFTASPLLLAAGGVALALVLVVGAWALVGNHSAGDPLVYPWSAQTPGQIDVSVSMEPTDLPSSEPTPVIEATGTAEPTLTASASGSPTPSAPVPKAGGLTATLGQANRYQGGYVVHFTVANNGTARVGGWRLEIWFNDNFKLQDSWNANVTQDTRHLVLTSQRAVEAGTSLDVGIRIEAQGANLGTPVSCTIDGRSFSCVPKWSS